LSAVLKRWQDEGRQQADLPAVEWCMATGFHTIEQRFADIIANLPNRFVAGLLKFVIQPFGARVRGPSDKVVHACAQMVLEPCVARDRLTAGLANVDDDNGVARLEKAFLAVVAAEDIVGRMRAARLRDPDKAVKRSVITQVEADQLRTVQEAVARAVEVDDFAPEALSPIAKKHAGVQILQERNEARAAG
jgi:acyl-CoA dehydrogenase